MAIFRAALLRAATCATRSFQVAPRSTRQFTTQLASTARPTPSFITFQRRLYSDEKDVSAQEGEESIQTDNEPVAEVTATEAPATPAETQPAEEGFGSDAVENAASLSAAAAPYSQSSAPPQSSGDTTPAAGSLDLPVSRKLYLGNLFFDITSEDLQREFNRFGAIENVRVVVDYKGFSKGFAFLAFESEAAAKAAKTEMDGQVLQGRRIIVNYTRPLFVSKAPPRPSEPTSTLFVGNLSYNLSDRDLNTLFRPLKNIRDVRIAIDRRTGQPRGFAHADFLDVPSAIEAHKKLNGFEIGGRSLKVDYSHSGRAAAMDNFIKTKSGSSETQQQSS